MDLYIKSWTWPEIRTGDIRPSQSINQSICKWRRNSSVEMTSQRRRSEPHDQSRVNRWVFAARENNCRQLSTILDTHVLSTPRPIWQDRYLFVVILRIRAIYLLRLRSSHSCFNIGRRDFSTTTIVAVALLYTVNHKKRDILFLTITLTDFYSFISF